MLFKKGSPRFTDVSPAVHRSLISLSGDAPSICCSSWHSRWMVFTMCPTFPFPTAFANGCPCDHAYTGAMYNDPGR